MAIWNVRCKEKHAVYERITAIGCVSDGTGNMERFPEDEAINRIDKKTDSFYVERPAGHRVAVIVAEHEGRKYLKTESDGEKPNNLLELPDCPAKKSVGSGTVRIVAAAVGSHGVLFNPYWGA